MNDFYDFLKCPNSIQVNTKPTIFYFFKLYIFYLILLIPIALFVYPISIIFGISRSPIEYPYFTKVLIIFLLAPIYEELLFRSLLRFNRNSILLFITGLALIIALAVFRENSTFLIGSLIILFLLLLIITIFPIEKISAFIAAKIFYFYYFTSLCFGLIHATNFSGNPWLILTFSIFLGGPQIVMGLILGYVRIKYGLLYSILFHIMINISVLLG